MSIILSASTQDLSSSSATSRKRDRWLRNESTTKAQELCVRDLLSLIVARVLFPSASLNVNPFAALKISLYDVIGRAFWRVCYVIILCRHMITCFVQLEFH